MRGKFGKGKNCILSLALTVASALLMGYFYDFYFAINDDLMIQDILSGAYGGRPDGHNMQTLYPLGLFLALCYRLMRPFPWYGAFLLLCQFGCFFLVGWRLCGLVDRMAAGAGITGEAGGSESFGGAKILGRAVKWRDARGFLDVFLGKFLCLSILLLFQWGIWLSHMVLAQYTVTSAMLMTAAVFLVLTAPFGLPARQYIVHNIPALLLALLAFWLRSEMGLLLLPLLGLAGAFHWWEEKPVFTAENGKKYCAVFLLLLAGMGVSLGADQLSYSGEWREFRQFFNDRTTIYDFYPEVLQEDAHWDALERTKSLAVTSSQRNLFRNYNYGLDAGIDGEMLSGMASYATEYVGASRDWWGAFWKAFWNYRSLAMQKDFFLLVFLGYLANTIAIVILYRKEYMEQGWKALFGLLCRGAGLGLLLLGRSLLWAFLLARGRYPARVTNPLYLAEFALLAALLVCRMAVGGGGKRARLVLWGFSAALALLLAGWVPGGMMKIKGDQEAWAGAARDWQAIDSYCRARPENFYLEDVFSWASFTVPMLGVRENSCANYDILGGWMCKSPLYREKLARWGIGDAAESLLAGESVFFLMSEQERAGRGLDWLADCYAEKGLAVQVEECDRIGESWRVYKITPVLKSGAGN